jgi:predicted RNA binding protein YcfA (HicA-like mRNA interferase family)
MPGVPVLKPREVIAILDALGFVEARQRGSHKQFRHPDGRATIVPFHVGRDISPILLRRASAPPVDDPVECVSALAQPVAKSALRAVDVSRKRRRGRLANP